MWAVRNLTADMAFLGVFLKQKCKVIEQESNQHDADGDNREEHSQQFWLEAFLSIIIEGRESAVTAIMKERMVPRPAPFANKLSATGIVPKMSAYIGTPTRVASGTEYHLSPPNTASTKDCGIKLWMTAPTPTPIKM